MRLFLLAFLIATPLAAQTTAPLQMGRPVFATGGRETMPMMLIDEAALASERFLQLPFPKAYWEQEKACVASVTGRQIEDVGEPPMLLVIPAVRTIRVHSMQIDSMLYAEDSTFTGEHWEPPTIAEALINSNFIIIVETFRANPYVLRHEALHFLLWRLKLAPLGHPPEYFGPCDWNFNPMN